MEWFTDVIVPILISLIPAAGMLIGTLAGVKVQLKTNELKAQEQREQIEKARIERDEERQKRQEEVLRCLLRTELLNMYFKHIERGEKHLTQWEAENIHKMYASYADLDGNSFVKDLYDRMNSWEVVKN